MNRRSFLKSAAAPAVAALPGLAAAQAAAPKFRISLAEWSLHKAIEARMIRNLDFPRLAREQFGIEGLEFVNGLWEAPTADYIAELKDNMRRFSTQGVTLMCDGEGLMGHSDPAVRRKAAGNHRKWVDIAGELGCGAIRTNMYGEREPSTPAEIARFLDCCADSFTRLAEYARPAGLNVMIENHGGISSDPDVLVRLMKMVHLPNLGLLPDFGNFPKEIDRYAAIGKMMPWAKGASFKCYDFGPDGREKAFDMDRVMNIVLDSGYHGWIGIEYEGDRLTEFEGIQAARRYLDRLLA